MITQLDHDALTLETERLILRPYMPGDEELLVSLLCDERVMHFVDDAMTPEAAREEFENSLKRGAGGRIGIWVVTRKDTDQKIGHGVLMPLPIEEDDYDWSLMVPDAYPPNDIEVGYLFLPDAWGQGFATEACRRLVQFFFEETDLPELVATADPEHVKSHNVLQKSGLRKIGLKRAYAWDDVLWFDLKREVWEKREATT